MKTKKKKVVVVQEDKCPIIDINIKKPEIKDEKSQAKPNEFENPLNLLKDKINATRKDFHLSRRAFHLINGSVVATFYWLFLSHSDAVHILGLFACLLYIFEQVRITYPQISNKLHWFYKYFMRAEEQLKESAMIPYAMGVLLTIISFPKIIAICSIYTLAFADPLSAIIGIKYGKTKLGPNRTLEGSIVFFTLSFLAISIPIMLSTNNSFYSVLIVAFMTSLMSVFLELLCLKLDDNLTIPIFTSICLWINGAAFGLTFI